MKSIRNPDFPIDSSFVERWSPRAFDKTPIANADLMTLFEAARWAPSAFNSQPWRFLYATRESADWKRFLSVLAPFNQSWAGDASVILLILSDTIIDARGEQKPSHSHSFDAGAAWASLALQATKMGFHTHGMTGVDFAAARDAMAVPERYRIECAVAVGRIGDPASLPDGLRARELPSQRHPVCDFAFAGSLPPLAT